MPLAESGTQIYGASDDLVEFDGEYRGEVGSYGTDDREKGVLVVCSDGTVAEVKYGKNEGAIWEVKVLRKGSLFVKVDPCDNEDDDPYSDILYLNDGIKWIYACTGEWELVS